MGAATDLFQVPAAGVAGWVVGQKTEDKKADKKGNYDINGDLKGQHNQRLREQALLSYTNDGP